MSMTARELRKNIVHILNGAGVTPAPFNADVLLEHFGGITKLMLLTDSYHPVSDDIAREITDAAIECAKGTPLQHIIGFTEFMGLRFKVNRNVLIPRPDTEILVAETLKHAEKLPPKINILDMCTGSGCIAIALSKYLDKADIHASDISEDALTVAKENAVSNRAENRIAFHSGSFFSPFTNNDKFDIIVSNPPYIPTDDIEKLSDVVKFHEPLNALDGGKDGLWAYKEILSEAPNYLCKNGIILFEVGIDQAEDVKKLLSESFTDIGVVRDYGGIERVVYGKLI